MRSRALTAVTVLFVASFNAPAEGLTIGDPAPGLDVKEFVKGDAVKTFEKKKIYVVEFWATWCGPCKESIPHLTELQKKFKDAIFIGVSILEENPKEVVPFVKKMGDKMDYRVAVDFVPAGESSKKGAMAQNWMIASGQAGIPTAFVVNGDGKVAWIGHPMDLEKPLEQIVAGKYDLQAAAVKYKRERLADKLDDVVNEALGAEKPKPALELIDKAIAADPELEDLVAINKFRLLDSKNGDPDQALVYGEKLLKTTLKENALGLNYLAWSVVQPDRANKADDKLVKLALLAATKADQLLDRNNPMYADTLARAYFVSGDVAKAIDTQDRAVKLAGKTDEARGMKERLEEYKKALKEKGNK
jgi:thiol-disulfide isomerase/thioredoxin